MVTSFEATAYGLKPFTIPRLVRHRQAASAFARLPPASAYGLQLRYNELKKAKGYQGWTEEEYGDRVLELMTLVPSLVEPARRFPAALILALLDDTGSVASRLISLKQLFPSADVFRIVSKRPKLLLEEEFTGAQIAATKLSQLFPETDLGLLVEKAPLLIVEDVDEIVAELRRLFPQTSSLAQHLIRAPQLVLTVQRGSKSLGPAAEF